MPPLLATTASEGINILTSTPSILTDLHTNIYALRSVLDKVDCITIPSHPASAIIHIFVRAPSTISTSSSLLSPDSAALAKPASPARAANPQSLVPREGAPTYDQIDLEERLLQEVVEEALDHGVLLSRAKRIRGIESLEPRPSIRITATAALSRKDTEKAAAVVKAALVKVLGRR